LGEGKIIGNGGIGLRCLKTGSLMKTLEVAQDNSDSIEQEALRTRLATEKGPIEKDLRRDFEKWMKTGRGSLDEILPKKLPFYEGAILPPPLYEVGKAPPTYTDGDREPIPEQGPKMSIQTDIDSDVYMFDV
jgi:hypothetical protein